MALEKFKQNLSKDYLDNELRKKWDSESLKVRNQILDDFCSFLQSEEFTVKRDATSAEAQYETASISLRTTKEIPSLLQTGEKPSEDLKFDIAIRYSKWGDRIVLRVSTVVTNQKKIFETSDNLEQYSKYIKDLQPFKYSFHAEMGNDHSKIGLFGKLFAVSQYGLTDCKEFNNIRDLVEAVLNDEFTMKGVW